MELKTKYIYSGIIGLIVGIVVGYFSSSWLWLIIIVLITTIIGGGLLNVKESHGIIIERFGAFHRLLKPGLKFIILPGIIDNNVAKIFTKEKQLEFFKDNQKIDFEDGSAHPANCKIFMKINHPFNSYEIVYKKNGETIKVIYPPGIYAYYYNIKNAEEALIQKIEGCLRAILTGKVIDEGIKIKGRDLTKKILVEYPGLEKDLKNWGIKIISISIADFELSKETIESKNEKYNAKTAKNTSVFVAEQRAEETAGTLFHMLIRWTGMETDELRKDLLKNPDSYKEIIKSFTTILRQRMSLENKAYIDINVKGLEGSDGLSSAVTLFQALTNKNISANSTSSKKNGRKFTEEEYERKIEKMKLGL